MRRTFCYDMAFGLLFCFRSRGSILLPIRKFSDIVIVRLNDLITPVARTRREAEHMSPSGPGALWLTWDAGQQHWTLPLWPWCPLVDLGCWATTLGTATLALVHSAADYCSPVWCHSAHTHLINKPINDALCIVTKCLRPTPTNNLFVLPGILQMSFAEYKGLTTYLT